MADEVRDFEEEDFEDIDYEDEVEYTDSCLDAFDIIDALLDSEEEIAKEDATLINMIDMEIADTNFVTEEQSKKLDELKIKYKVKVG